MALVQLLVHTTVTLSALPDKRFRERERERERESCYCPIIHSHSADMGDKDKVKLKSLCYRCHVNKWIVDFKEGYAANISNISVCLACEQAEKSSKLEKTM